MQNNTLQCKYSLNFVNGDKKSVHLIESNSMYYFYVVKGAKNISISPISSINTIELIENKILEKK